MAAMALPACRGLCQGWRAVKRGDGTILARHRANSFRRASRLAPPLNSRAQQSVEMVDSIALLSFPPEFDVS